MERHSALASKKLGVGVEQVAIFLTADNTVIAFFEHSADDVEEPILPRLRTEETILRRSSDASMLTQAILDAIIDMAVSVPSFPPFFQCLVAEDMTQHKSPDDGVLMFRT